MHSGRTMTIKQDMETVWKNFETPWEEGRASRAIIWHSMPIPGTPGFYLAPALDPTPVSCTHACIFDRQDGVLLAFYFVLCVYIRLRWFWRPYKRLAKYMGSQHGIFGSFCMRHTTNSSGMGQEFGMGLCFKSWWGKAASLYHQHFFSTSMQQPHQTAAPNPSSKQFNTALLKLGVSRSLLSLLGLLLGFTSGGCWDLISSIKRPRATMLEILSFIPMGYSPHPPTQFTVQNLTLWMIKEILNRTT